MINIVEALDLKSDKQMDYYKLKKFKKGTKFYYHGDTNDILIIKSGTAVIQALDKFSNWSSREIATPNYLLTPENLLEFFKIPEQFDYRVVAMEAVEVYFVNREYFLNHLHLNPLKFQYFYEAMIIKYVQQSKKMFIINEPPIVKTANALYCIIYTLYPGLNENYYALPKYINQKTVAEYSGTGQARTSESFQRLRELNIINNQQVINLPLLLNFIFTQ
ncbi:hypothetical protein CKN73_02995 [Carnobacterium divergens]|uniref:Crp/Fnr family transcriptional regulator n=1 Tax=Carnobacterium divergens TaxID=2748 RepID=UPI000E728B13|nr:Crp/Fnr family transcriptional regulator [Carnobacterium divergens]ANZ98914.1 hypothetical protein BFC22_01835 [Carnobacterium divergens]TFJ43622.1 hypothetical protein CKN77_02925 [Carnobacterium divergens]TFJ51452.1 hypothetical protein CKN73_02995 [Carnobacterium divergens]TFJ56442.1 hypothetical protein CKN83_02940 [Carnobacterium divergens]TFJ64082.1 hypothetical protein CKN89_03020 [Carnobacterium divergens]